MFAFQGIVHPFGFTVSYGVDGLDEPIYLNSSNVTEPQPVDRVTLRYRGKLHHIGVGNPYAGWRVVLLVNGLDIQILGLDGSPLRHLVLDPSLDYQRIP